MIVKATQEIINTNFYNGAKNGFEEGYKAVDKIYDDFEVEKQKLQKEVAYWKLSFKKQCEARK